MPADELIDVVDENDIILGSMPKNQAYDSGQRVRLVHVAVIDPQTKKIAIQRRGKELSWQPLHYCAAVCGHVGAGEAWEDAAARELHEEMGVSAPLTLVNKIPFTSDYPDHFMLGIYTVEVAHTELKPDPREVEEVLSLTRDEICQIIDRGEKLHNTFVPVMKSVLGL